MTGIIGFLKFFIMVLLVHQSLQTARSQAPVKLRSTLGINGSSKTIDLEGKKIFIQQSTGQYSVTGLSRGGDYLLRQGFIQPFRVAVNRIASSNLQLSITPNPFQSEISVSFNEEISEDIYISISDLSGRTVYFKRHGTGQEIRLNPGRLPDALYFIRVYSGNKYYISKLIKE